MTEHWVFVAMLPQQNGGEAKCAGRRSRAGVKLPTVRLENPRPSQWLTGGHDIHNHNVIFITLGLKRDAPALDEIKSASLPPPERLLDRHGTESVLRIGPKHLPREQSCHVEKDVLLLFARYLPNS